MSSFGDHIWLEIVCRIVHYFHPFAFQTFSDAIKLTSYVGVECSKCMIILFLETCDQMKQGYWIFDLRTERNAGNGRLNIPMRSQITCTIAKKYHKHSFFYRRENYQYLYHFSNIHRIFCVTFPACLLCSLSSDTFCLGMLRVLIYLLTTLTILVSCTEGVHTVRRINDENRSI